MTDVKVENSKKLVRVWVDDTRDAENAIADAMGIDVVDGHVNGARVLDVTTNKPWKVINALGDAGLLDWWDDDIKDNVADIIISTVKGES